jgi:hypothetical protein
MLDVDSDYEIDEEGQAKAMNDINLFDDQGRGILSCNNFENYTNKNIQNAVMFYGKKMFSGDLNPPLGWDAARERFLKKHVFAALKMRNFTFWDDFNAHQMKKRYFQYLVENARKHRKNDDQLRLGFGRSR